jgi:hypothetical protein
MSADAPDRQVRELEEQIEVLSAALGITSDDPAAVVPPEVFRLARSGDRMKAIRLLRKDIGMSLLAAKRAVDEIIA